MKISEALALVKQKEGELMRLYQSRDSIVAKIFDKSILQMDKLTKRELDAEKERHETEKKRKFDAINAQIEHLQKEIIDLKNKANKRNTQLGIDLKLAEVKILRIELSKLMNFVKKDYLLHEVVDIDTDQRLGLSNRIKELEARKMGLDNAIQNANWSNEL